MVPPKVNLLFFSQTWAQQTTIHVNCFTDGLGWHTSCHPISKMHIVGEGPGETPSSLRCLSYLINKLAHRHKVNVAQSCLTLCDPMDCSLPGSSIHGILQARILEWIAISFSNSCMHAKLLQLCLTLCDPMDSSHQAPLSLGFSRQEYWSRLPFPALQGIFLI